MGLDRLQLGAAFNLVVKTAPILLVRLGLYLAFWVLLLIYWGITIGLAYLVGQVFAPLGWILAVVALVSTFPIYNLAYKYVFYLLKAAHIAVMAELLVNGELPDGASQLAWGKDQVTKRFGQVSVMFVVDEIVESVVRVFTGLVFSIASWLPGDSIRTLVGIINRVIRYSTSYIDEAILARAFWRRDENIWESAQEGLVLYGMVWKPLVANAVALMVISYIPFLLVWLLFSAPIGGLLSIFSPTLAGWSVIIALIFAFFVKVAIGDSFAMAAILAAYQRETKNLTPDPVMEAHLTQISDKFRDLKDRALAAMSSSSSFPGLPSQSSNAQPPV
ncbi:hypothetical protein BH10CHL1_BH10CHL1_30650 [soil metagenome]